MNLARSAICFVFTALVACGGCGRDTGRAAVAGAVTVDGQPLAKGTIRFVATGDTQGPLAAGEINAGKYSIDAEQGPVIGEHRVEIFADDSDQLPYDIMDPAEYQKHGPFQRPVQPLPARYNTATTLTATIRADQANKIDFALTSKP
jgi:hypothetical protein